MKIQEIYRKYKISPNLQQHMLRVAAVGAFIIDHFKDTTLDKDSILQALLLHDTGNIIKFDFSLAHLLGEEEKNIAYWQQVQQEYKDKYQDDENFAAIAIAKEIGISNHAFALLNAVGSAKLDKALITDDWNKKVVCYSDFRVDPHGIVAVNKRFDDIVARYAGRQHELGNIEEIERRRERCLKLEKQLQSMGNYDLQKLSNIDIEPYVKEMSDVQVFKAIVQEIG